MQFLKDCLRPLAFVAMALISVQAVSGGPSTVVLTGRVSSVKDNTITIKLDPSQSASPRPGDEAKISFAVSGDLIEVGTWRITSVEGDVAIAEKVEAEGHVTVTMLARITSNAPGESGSSFTATQQGGAEGGTGTSAPQAGQRQAGGQAGQAAETSGPLNPEMVRVRGGCFEMGGAPDRPRQFNEKPQHRVCVKDFAIGKYEVTQSQWQAVMGTNPSHFKGPNRPVEQVNWADAQDYIRKLNARTGKSYRLPTEAEWEYACRSGGKSEFYCGGDDMKDFGWYVVNARRETHPVGGKRANGLGLYDMSGNVKEWTCSAYDDHYGGHETRCASRGPHVIRGGSWKGYPVEVRSASRGYTLDPRTYEIGLRLAQD
ncbi:MAG: formylglycine-generating enzyme family protein [Arenicellales bacterium]